MMGSNGQTIVAYQGLALPTNAAGGELFNSITAFPPGGSFQLLGLQWFQWSLRFVNAAGTGIVTGQYSVQGRNTVLADWRDFYSRTGITSGATVANEDEVYVGMYKDIRFIFTPSADTTVFEAQLALNPHKSTSTHATTDILVP